MAEMSSKLSPNGDFKSEPSRQPATARPASQPKRRCRNIPLDQHHTVVLHFEDIGYHYRQQKNRIRSNQQRFVNLLSRHREVMHTARHREVLHTAEKSRSTAYCREIEKYCSFNRTADSWANQELEEL